MLKIGRCHLGDCLQLMSELPDESVDLILTDPPYGVTANEGIDELVNPDLFWKEARRILKPTGTAIVFGVIPFLCDFSAPARDLLKYDIVWKKNRKSNIAHAKNKPLREHENLFVFSKGTTVHKTQSKSRYTYNPQGVQDGKGVIIQRQRNSEVCFGNRPSHKEKYEVQGSNYPTTIKEYKVPSNKGRKHPSEKPLDFMEELVLTYSEEGELVLDPFAGSGTTLLAAKKHNRAFIGFELSEKYCKETNERLNDE